MFRVLPLSLRRNPWAAVHFPASNRAALPHACALLALACFPATPALSQAPPSADTMIVNAKPTQNFGGSAILAVQPGTTSLVQFNLTGIPANATIQKATLRLYVDAVQAPGVFDAFPVDTAWAENTVDFATAPNILTNYSSTGTDPHSITAASKNTFVLLNVTSIVQAWVQGLFDNHGLALSLTSTAGSFSFDSKESTWTSHEPELEIVVANSGPQGPPGPAGPQGSAGPQGPAGSNGVTGIVMVNVNDVVPSGFGQTLINAACPAGKVVISGGCDAVFLSQYEPGYFPPSILKNTPSSPTTYTCLFAGGTGINMPVAAVAVCANAQ